MRSLYHRNSWKVGIVLTLILLVSSVVVFADSSSLDGNGYMSSTGVWVGGAAKDYVYAQSSGSGCATKQIMVAMNFNLTGVQNDLASASLTLRVLDKTLPGTGHLALIPVNNTSFTTDTGAAGIGTLVPSDFDLTNPIGDPILFTSLPANDTDLVISGDALTTYLNTHKGGNVALGVIIYDCSTGSPNVYFASSRATVGAPSLTYTPTAITLSTFQAANPAVNWPLIVGLGALVALTAGGVLFYRKRATTH